MVFKAYIFINNNLLNLIKSSLAAGRTTHRLGNTSTCPQCVFRHITKSSPSQRLLRPAADDNFAICQNARLLRPAADDDFLITFYLTRTKKSLTQLSYYCFG